LAAEFLSGKKLLRGNDFVRLSQMIQDDLDGAGSGPDRQETVEWLKGLADYLRNRFPEERTLCALMEKLSAERGRPVSSRWPTDRSFEPQE
jgi:hypothetical protein